MKSVLRLLGIKKNRGYGGAIKSGIEKVQTKYVVTIDADGQHSLEDIDALYMKILETDADMIIGSRQGQMSASKIRGVGKCIIRGVAKMLMPLDIYDINSGMKMCNASIAKEYIHMCPNGMSYSDVIALLFVNENRLVYEEPIIIKQRVTGKSTISIHTAVETLREIVNIVMMFNPSKIFFPISTILFLLGLGWGLPIVIQGRGVSIGSSLLIIVALLIFLLGLLAEQLAAIRKRLNK
ncbi:MAG: glycosyltransferase family 2 protein [Phycisphaerae bacterium]|nr:glycosyltransferase family 2 protein [Phycisphaerae bacterium]